MKAADSIYLSQTSHAGLCLQGLWQQLVQLYQLTRHLGVSCIDVETERLQQAPPAAPIAAIDQLPPKVLNH